MAKGSCRQGARRARTRLAAATFLFFAVVLMLAVLAVGCGGDETTTTTATTASATSTSAGTETTGETGTTASTGPATSIPTKTYTDSEYKFTFDYPKDWHFTAKVTSQSEAGGASVKDVGAFDPKGNATDDTLLDGFAVSIYKLTQVVDESLMPAFGEELRGVLENLEGQLTDAKRVSELTETSVNGMPGYETMYTFAQKGKPMRARMFFIVNGDLEYQITLQTVDSIWEAKQPLLNIALNSFKATE